MANHLYMGIKIMKKILMLAILFLTYGFSPAQQINYTWGYTTAGVALNQSGASLDSSDTKEIVFDMQDYSFLDWNPLSLDSVTVIGNSDALFLGTLWYRLDLQNATDSSEILIQAFPGNMIYHPNDGSRITTSNINYSTTAITILDTAGSYTTNDIQWTAKNIYLHASVKTLSSEFLKVKISFNTATNDSLGWYHNFAYPAVYDVYQRERKTTRTNKTSKKRAETLH